MALVEMSLSNIHSGHPNLETSTVCSLLFKRKMIKKKYIYINHSPCGYHPYNIENQIPDI